MPPHTPTRMVRIQSTDHTKCRQAIGAAAPSPTPHWRERRWRHDFGRELDGFLKIKQLLTIGFYNYAPFIYLKEWETCSPQNLPGLQSFIHHRQLWKQAGRSSVDSGASRAQDVNSARKI